MTSNYIITLSYMNTDETYSGKYECTFEADALDYDDLQEVKKQCAFWLNENRSSHGSFDKSGLFILNLIKLDA